MGRFHDELVNARREGKAPGQEASIPTETANLTADITFAPPSEGVPLVCSRCGGVVDAGRVAGHVDWHRVTGS